MARSRNTDPHTSHQAAAEAEASGRASGQRHLCLDDVVRRPGQTAAEIAMATNLERHVPSRRLPELRSAGLIRNGEVRKCLVTGRNSMTWYPRNPEGDTMIATSTPDFIQHEPAEIYHAKASEFLSSHALADFRKSPWLFRKKKLGLILDEDRPAYVLGRAAHVLILEGRQAFGDAYAVGGPINPRTGNPYGANTKAFAEWAAEQGKPVLTHDQVHLLEQLASGVSMNSIAVDFLASGVAEGVVRHHYMDMACQIRMDWFSEERGLVDLKTCDDLTWFESDARRYGYAHQLAFYRAVLKEATGDRFPVHIIAIEKREPYRCGVWRIGDDVLGIAKRENEDAIKRLKRCVAKDQWPTGFESIRVFDYL